ncbi:MAG TPA: hypothetical protein VNB90_14660 [Cytophagaceae bacterium]|jgi:hypothetical protein|nr:hypothetical protein [Cytophagaceae bacterium]
MQKTDDEIIEELIARGIISEALGKILTNKKQSVLKSLARVALLSSYAASENAKRSAVPLMIVKNNVLYQTSPGGIEIFVKDLPKLGRVPKRFNLNRV